MFSPLVAIPPAAALVPSGRIMRRHGELSPRLLSGSREPVKGGPPWDEAVNRRRLDRGSGSGQRVEALD